MPKILIKDTKALTEGSQATHSRAREYELYEYLCIYQILRRDPHLIAFEDSHLTHLSHVDIQQCVQAEDQPETFSQLPPRCLFALGHAHQR